MVTILISASFRGVALIRGEVLLEGGTYFNANTQKCGTY